MGCFNELQSQGLQSTQRLWQWSTFSDHEVWELASKWMTEIGTWQRFQDLAPNPGDLPLTSWSSHLPLLKLASTVPHPLGCSLSRGGVRKELSHPVKSKYKLCPSSSHYCSVLNKHMSQSSGLCLHHKPGIQNVRAKWLWQTFKPWAGREASLC